MKCDFCGFDPKKAVEPTDLAIWWEAYRAALGGFCARIGYQAPIDEYSVDFANRALADYKAKAAELAGKKYVEDAVASERERCAGICEAHARTMQSAADTYPGGTSACFVEEALECARRIRGEK